MLPATPQKDITPVTSEGTTSKKHIAVASAQAMLWTAKVKDPKPVTSEQALQWGTPGKDPTTVTLE